MEGGIQVDAPLDYASFQILPTENRYEAFVCCDGKIEKLSSGPLEQLVFHLPKVKTFHPEKLDNRFKLQLPQNLKRSSYFSKFTFARFLRFVDMPELLKVANAIGDEMSQLEEARKFHLSLYTQGHQNDRQTEETDCGNTEEMEPTKKPELQIKSSDATKNELLRAMDLRLTALREELVVAFNQAADCTCSFKQIADLVAFCQNFGAEYLRSSLVKYLELSQKNQDANPANEQPEFSEDLNNDSGKLKNVTTQVCPLVVKPVKYGASPAKAAHVERHSSTESDESSNSSDEERLLTERSRPLLRSASPRRSASPMRRVQIGRSGSHRAPALTIKSLGFFPARERMLFNKDAAENSSDEESDQPQKKPVSNSRSMSVQDAINLFERKQRDENSDMQKRRFSADTSVTNKSVLRRWSGRTGDSSSQCPPENACEGGDDTIPNNLAGGEIQRHPVKPYPESDLNVESMDPVKTDDVGESLTAQYKNAPNPTEKLADTVLTPAVEINNRVSASVEWSRQKEDELNIMMTKMMESKPARYQRSVNESSKSQEFPSGQRGGSYDQYKKKRDEKVRVDNSGKRAEEQLKTFQEILDQRKAEMASKAMGIAGKQDSLVRSQKPQKKSNPTMQPKWESSKTTVSRKASPKSLSLPATRKSWPSTPSPKPAAVTPSKTPNGLSSAGTTTRRKSQPTPSPTQSRPKVERTQKPKEIPKTTPIEAKRGLKGQEVKKQQALTSSKTTKTKDRQSSGGSALEQPAKPSFYNKVTKKGSVVPLESKPFLRKRSGGGPGIGPVKTKITHSDESIRSSSNLIPTQEEVELSKPMTQQQDDDVVQPVSDVVQPVNDVDLQPEASAQKHQKSENTESINHIVYECDDTLKRTAEFPVEVQPEEVSTISPIAWVEVEHQELPGDSCSPQIVPENVAPEGLSSPRIRHSLSQMLQEDSGEPEIMEWGNAENPPAIVYQKDVPKGLKRLLKFARKSKGEANVSGWSSPTVFSEGEDDTEEPKDGSVRQADAILRKSSLQGKGGKQKTTFAASSYGGNSSKGAVDCTAAIDLLSAQTNMSRFASQEGHIAATSTKSTRSFFSLSTFRSSK